MVSVWSDACQSANITCGNLSPGSSFSVQINVTNAIIFNAFEFYLFYDPAFINATGFDLFQNTVFANGNPSNLVQNVFSPLGRQVHLAVANFANPPSFSKNNGTLANIFFKVLKVGVSPLVLSAPIAPAPQGGTLLITNTTPILVTTSDGYFRNDFSSKVKFVDNPPANAPNTPGTWSSGKTVIYDVDRSGTYTLGDIVMAGTAPLIGTNLSVDSNIKFVDTPPAPSPNSPSVWFSGKAVVWDADSSGTYSTGDIVISGTPVLGSNLSVDALHGPVASFTYSPTAPKQGDVVTFNATSSFDPDGGLLNTFTWEFGAGNSFGSRTPIYNYRLSAGNFSVRLIVIDSDDGFEGMQVQRVGVALADFHDVAIQALTAADYSIQPGKNTTLTAVVLDKGNFAEKYNLTLTYGQPGVLVGSALNQTINAQGSAIFPFTFASAGLAPGFYTIQAVVNLTRDDDLANDAALVTVRVLGTPAPASDLPLLLVGSFVIVIAAIVITVSLLRRRRRARDVE